METPKAHFDFLSGNQELSTIAGGTALGAGATATGMAYDCGKFVGAPYGPSSSSDNAGPILPRLAGHAAPAYFRAFASSDQQGTLEIEQSADLVNWFVTDGTADNIAAGFKTKSVYIESKICLRYVRAVLVNGSTAQTEVEFDTALVSI